MGEGGGGGGCYCTVCYAMNYECMTLLILKSWETKNRSTSVSNTVENEGWTVTEGYLVAFMMENSLQFSLQN